VKSREPDADGAVIRFRGREAHYICVGLVAVGVFTSACSSSKTAPSQSSRVSSAPVLQLWGDMKPVVSVKELMRDLIDPASDYVFDAVGTVITRKGVVETSPRHPRIGTEFEWVR
jgi:hypothetical protein